MYVPTRGTLLLPYYLNLKSTPTALNTKYKGGRLVSGRSRLGPIYLLNDQVHWRQEALHSQSLIHAMRERVTFLHRRLDDTFDPSQLHLQNDSIRLTSLKAAREDKLTFGLYELPQEVFSISNAHRSHTADPLLIFIAVASFKAMS